MGAVPGMRFGRQRQGMAKTGQGARIGRLTPAFLVVLVLVVGGAQAKPGAGHGHGAGPAGNPGGSPPAPPAFARGHGHGHGGDGGDRAPAATGGGAGSGGGAAPSHPSPSAHHGHGHGGGHRGGGRGHRHDDGGGTAQGDVAGPATASAAQVKPGHGHRHGARATAAGHNHARHRGHRSRAQAVGATAGSPGNQFPPGTSPVANPVPVAPVIPIVPQLPTGTFLPSTGPAGLNPPGAPAVSANPARATRPGAAAAAPRAFAAALGAGALSPAVTTTGPTVGGGTPPGGGSGNGGTAAPAPSQAVITRVINTIPTAIWAVLGGLAALALVLGGTALIATNRSRRRARTIAAIQGLATTDSLTGVLNRGAFEERLQAELARARRYARPLGVLTFDVEGLKAINDAHGHSAGDDVLRSVAGVLTQSIRDHDVCGRMGGDEYAVLVTEQDRAGSEKVLQRIAAQMPTCRADVGLRTPWGLSAGIATFPRDGESVRELLDAADRRLYLSRGIRIEPVA